MLLNEIAAKKAENKPKYTNALYIHVMLNCAVYMNWAELSWIDKLRKYNTGVSLYVN